MVSIYITNHPGDMDEINRDLELIGCQILTYLETVWFIRKEKSRMNEVYLTKS